VEGARTSSLSIETTGIGDGGNELGMGTVNDAVRRCIPMGDLIVSCPVEVLWWRWLLWWVAAVTVVATKMEDDVTVVVVVVVVTAVWMDDGSSARVRRQR
jgi:hypothetical protein